MQILSNLKTFQGQDHQDRFGKQIVELVPSLKPYVYHRLHIVAELGFIPKNMYTANDIVDDAILELFGEDLNRFTDSSQLKIEAFRLVKKYLDELYNAESWHHHTVSTDKILQQELNKLKEQFTVDADNDMVMLDELEDISYHQKDHNKALELYNDAEHSLISAFDLKQWEKPHTELFHKMYNFLNWEASNVVDLYVFGKLNSSEIAQIKGVDELVVREIISQVKDKIKDLLKESV